jgi:hypothetical protein
MVFGGSVQFSGGFQGKQISLGFLSGLEFSVEKTVAPDKSKRSLTLEILLRAKEGSFFRRVVFPLGVYFFLGAQLLRVLGGEVEAVVGLPAREGLGFGEEVERQFAFVYFDEVELAPGFAETVPLGPQIEDFAHF